MLEGHRSDQPCVIKAQRLLIIRRGTHRRGPQLGRLQRHWQLRCQIPQASGAAALCESSGVLCGLCGSG